MGRPGLIGGMSKPAEPKAAVGLLNPMTVQLFPLQGGKLSVFRRCRSYGVQCPGVPVGFFGVITAPQTEPPVAHTAKP